MATSYDSRMSEHSTINIGAELAKRLDAYRRAQHITTAAQALRTAVAAGLAAIEGSVQLG